MLLSVIILHPLPKKIIFSTVSRIAFQSAFPQEKVALPTLYIIVFSQFGIVSAAAAAGGWRTSIIIILLITRQDIHQPTTSYIVRTLLQ
jgi:hypothetical protein